MTNQTLSRRSFIKTSLAAGGGLMLGFHMPVALAASISPRTQSTTTAVGTEINAWIVIDKENKTENGNFKLRPFTNGWNYKPERAIDKLDIVGIGEEGARDKLMKSLEKGNRHQVTAMKDGKEVKLYLEANPAEHRVNLTNWKGEAQQLEHYKKPELKNDAKKEQKQAQTTEGAPAKKPRKSAKMKV